MSSMTEAVISKVIKRPVLWDLQIKDYHNRDFVDKEWRNFSQTLKISSTRFYIAYVFSLYTKTCTSVQNLVHVIK
jgi:hypothetical protein